MTELGSNFFHYTSCETAFDHIVPRRQLRFSPYSEMRDPSENKRWFFDGSGWHGDDTEPAQEQQAAFNSYANEIRASAKLLSLTFDGPASHEDRCLPGWQHARMWEQYAQRHEGVCLVFGRNELIACLTADLTAQHAVGPYHQAVHYLPEHPQHLVPPETSPEATREWVQQRHVELFFVKAPDWRTECEYRFVVTNDRVEYVFADFGASLRMVILGERFPSESLSRAKAACIEAGAELLKIEWIRAVPRIQPFRLEG